jgi:hypothetical protein
MFLFFRKPLGLFNCCISAKSDVSSSTIEINPLLFSDQLNEDLPRNDRKPNGLQACPASGRQWSELGKPF